jgi:hypothetical protein
MNTVRYLFPSIQIVGMIKIMRTIILLLSLIPLCAWALDPWGEMIPVHGRYSKLYESDWSKLGTAKQNWDRSPGDYTWKTGLSGLKRTYSGSLCEVKNIARKVGAGDRGSSSILFDFNNCDKTIIENVAIWFTDKYSFSYTFRFQHSNDVYIKNLYIRGGVQATHVELRGGRYVYMNNVEIEGVDYTGDGKEENGRGVWIFGGLCAAEGSCQTGPYQPFKFFVLQNMYIHDFDGDKYKGNFPEAIAITSAGDGIVFNCFAEHWRANGNVIMQAGHRRVDSAYGQGYVTRIERTIVNDGIYLKQGAAWTYNDHSDNHTIWANNIFNGINIAADFKQEEQDYVNNTWLMTSQTPFRVWNQRRMLHFYNNLIYFNGGGPSQFFNRTPGQDTDDKRLLWDADNNLYYGHTPSRIWADANSSRNANWSTWQNLGKDKHSKLTNSDPLFANKPNNFLYTLASNSLARGMGSAKYVNNSRAGLRVNKDFFGKTRSSQTPDIGAIAYASSSSDKRLPAPKNVKINIIK